VPLLTSSVNKKEVKRIAGEIHTGLASGSILLSITFEKISFFCNHQYNYQ
jgi:hypothetical protein